MAPQVRELLQCEAEHEVGREAILIAANRTGQDFSFDSIQLRQILIEHDLASPDYENPGLNGCGRDGRDPTVLCWLFRWHACKGATGLGGVVPLRRPLPWRRLRRWIGRRGLDWFLA